MKKEHGPKSDSENVVASAPQVAAIMRAARVKRTDARGLLPLAEARRFLAATDVFRRGKARLVRGVRVFESDRVWAALLSLENAEEFVRHAKHLSWEFGGRGRNETAVLERYGAGILPWIESRLSDETELVNIPSCVLPCLLALGTASALELALRIHSVTEVARPSAWLAGRTPKDKVGSAALSSNEDDDDDDDESEEEEVEDEENVEEEDSEEEDSAEALDDLDIARRWITRHPTFYADLVKLAYGGHPRAEALLRDRARALGGAVREALEQSLGFAEAERYTERFNLLRTRLPEDLEKVLGEAELHPEPRGPVWTIAELDDAVRRDEIPSWDSPNYTTVAMRLTGYASQHGDALVIEQIVYRPSAKSPVVWEMFAYGPGSTKRRANDELVNAGIDGLENVEIGDGDFVDGITNQIIVLGDRDEKGRPVPHSDVPRIIPLPLPTDEISVRVKRPTTRTRGEELEVHARLPRSFVKENDSNPSWLRLVTPAEALVVDLARRHRRLLFATDRDLRTAAGVASGAHRLFSFDDFEYFRTDQFPSSSKDLVAVVEALRGRRKLTRLPGQANTKPEVWIPMCAERRSYAGGDAWADDDNPFALEGSEHDVGISPYWSFAYSRGYPHGVWLLHGASQNKKGQAEQAILHLVGSDQPVLRTFWPRRTACMWTRVCGLAERKWATMDRGIAAAMKTDRMLHLTEAQRLIENFVLRAWNIPARTGTDFVLLLEALVGGAEVVEAFASALSKLPVDAWNQPHPALEVAVFELGYVIRRAKRFVGAATDRLRVMLSRARATELARRIDLITNGRAGAERSARCEADYAHVPEPSEWVRDKLVDPATPPSPPDVFLVSLAGDGLLAKYEKRLSQINHAAAFGSQLARLSTSKVIPMVLSLYAMHPDARAVISQALFERPHVRKELGSLGRGAHAKVAKALLIALEEAEERAEIRSERLESLDDYADEDESLGDDFDDTF
ncbi:MAG TPA: hypothetical protein PK156_35965 [Polyangium sp.]|nr:hypothetical protein [Polyangium sp.]